MNDVKSIFLLSVVCLQSISSGCRFQNPSLRPEDKVVRLSKREPSPLAKKDGNYKSGDEVMIIEDNGKLSSAKAKGNCGELAPYVRREYAKESEPVPSENDSPTNSSPLNEEIKRISTKSYVFEHGKGKSKYLKCFPPERIFPMPWANNANLKIGDVVYSKGNRISASEKGIVTQVPAESNGNFRVRFDSKTDSTPVEISEIWASIKPAKSEDLSPGDFVRYDKLDWAMVVGKRDDNVIIRPFSSWEWGWEEDDLMVDVSKLQILK